MASQIAVRNMGTFANNLASSPFVYPRIARIRDECEMTGAPKTEARQLIANEIWEVLSSNYNGIIDDYPLMEGIITLDLLGIDVNKVADMFLEGYGPRGSKCVKRKTTATKPKSKPKQSSQCLKKKSTGKTSTTKPKSKPKQGSSQRKPAPRRRR